MMLRRLKEMFHGEKGQGLVEYALLLALVVGIVVALTSSNGLQDAIQGLFNGTTNQIEQATPN